MLTPSARCGASTSHAPAILPRTRAEQYVSAQHAGLAERHGIRLSVGRRGQRWDNAVAESFFATIKTELLYRQAWPTRTAARQATFEYVEGWYNTRRQHSSLGYLSAAAYKTSTSDPVPLENATAGTVSVAWGGR
jgi:transposase InsO family protein